MALSELHSGSRAKAPGAPVTARGVNGRFAPAEAPGREAGANRGGNADFPPALRTAGGRGIFAVQNTGRA